ncbi:MAG: DUF1428 domain-containing protein [Phycisphaerales bacterium]
MAYVDGYVIPVPKKNIKSYMKMAAAAGKIWREYGATQYCECAGDDLKTSFGVSFSKLAKTKPGETVVFSWIVYKTKAQRDKVNAKVMKDPRLAAMMDPKKMPFDVKRLSFGGFTRMVDA